MKVQILCVLLTFRVNFLINCCKFQNYADALIPEESYPFVQEYQVNIREQFGNSYGFGFWMMRSVVLEQNSSENFFKAKEKKSNKLLFMGYLYNNYETTFSVSYNGILQNYKFYEFLNIWHFTLLTHVISKNIQYIQISGKNVNSYRYNQNIQQDLLLEVTLGSKQFQGKISKLQFYVDFFYDESTFLKFSSECSIPKPLNEIQSLQIISYQNKFEVDNTFQSEIYVYGNRYSISGWVKYTYDQLTYYFLSQSVRISKYQKKLLEKKYGDDLFNMEVIIQNYYFQNSKIKITIDCLCDNSYFQECKLFQNSLYTPYYEFNLTNSTNDAYYKGLLQWHYFQYEYGRSDYKNELMQFSIYFTNSLGLIQKKIENLKSFSIVNKKLYLFVAENNQNSQTLKTEIYDLKFQYYYEQDLNFSILCHPTCQECNGPFKNNCLTCKQNLNRVLSDERNQCECQKGYFQFEDEVYCRRIEDSSIQISSIVKINSYFCQFGQFYYPSSNGEHYCFQCPQFKELEYNCANCLFSSLNWYLEPICSKDLLSRGKQKDDAYNIIYRNSTKIDIYFVDNLMNLNLIFGAESFCDSLKDENCYFINQTYLGKQISVKCKNGFNFSDYQCKNQQSDSNKIVAYQSSDQKCSKGMYLFQNFCYGCPINCINCYYNFNEKKPLCNICQQSYTLSNNTCVKCQTKCKICEETFNLEFKINYIQCLRCIDDSLYYLSDYGTSCNKNEIPGCKYAIQYKQQSQKVVTLCAYCSPFSDYNTLTNTCIKGNEKQSELTICHQKIIRQQNSFCILSGTLTISNSFYINCSDYISNCNLCQRTTDYNLYICILCLSGYYANRLTGNCEICPKLLLQQNCDQCGQQQKKSQDYWKYELRPFYRQFLETKNIFEFITHEQSQYQSDYEIICTNCVTGYVLHNGECIKDCPEFCNECELINDQYQCVRCEKSTRGRSLTLLNNECIQCSEYCALCRKRTNQEIFDINPLFNSTEFLEFTYQCLKSYDDDQYQYDSELGQFIKCEFVLDNCENQLQIDLNLYCDQNKYQIDLNQSSNEQEKIDFLNKNILISDLFSNNSFQQFQNNLFFRKANIRKIRSIVINISSNHDLFCDFGKNAMISQKFGLNIFSVLNVTLNLSFSLPTVFQFEETFSLENFNQVYLRGVQFQPKFINIFNSQISFISVYPQTISLTNIIFQSISQQYNQQSILIHNLKDLKIFNFILQNTNIINTTGFITIFQNQIQKTIFIQNFIIKNGQFNNTNIFSFKLGDNDQIIFENINVKSNFFNSSLILIEKKGIKNQNSQSGYLIIKDADFSINLKNTFYFLDIEGVKQFTLYKILLMNSTLVRSQFINSCLNNLIEDAIFQNIKLNQSSSLIINSDFLVSENALYKYNSIIFSNIEYDSKSNFIRLQKQYTQNQTLIIYQIKLINNFCTQKIENQSKLSNSLLYINLNYVIIQNFEILSMHGITELFIYDTIKFTLESTYLQRIKKNGNFGLHKYLECFINRMQNLLLSEMIIIYSSQETMIKNLTVSNAFFHNSAFLLIKSADSELITQKERIYMNILKLQNNIIIQTNGQSQVSLIQIKSNQKSQIEINDIQFINNILHQYYQNNLQTSATLININCEFCIFYLIKALVINNTVTNGTDSIIFVNVRLITFENNIFDSNSVFLYQLFQPYLFWEFEYDKEVYLENIEEIFPIKSISGNGWLIAQKINITDNQISNSKGKAGGGFRLQGKGSSQIYITNLKLDRISTFFQSKEEYGGALYFDGQNAQQLDINIYNVQANEIFCKNQGGLFFIQIVNINSKIDIKNITFFEVFAFQGSLAYFDFFVKSQFEQNLYINQVVDQNTEVGLEKFFLSFKNSYNEDVYALANNRSLLFIESGSKIMIESFMIFSSFCESLLYQNNGKNIGLKQIRAVNSIICNQFISISFIEDEQSKFQIVDSYFYDLKFSRQISKYECNQGIIKVPSLQFFCSNQYFNAPKQIMKLQTEKNQNNFFVCILNQINLNPQGFIILDGLTSYSQIILQNIEFNSILCENCFYGLIYINIKSSTLLYNSILIFKIDLLSSNCGNSSCISTKVNSMNNDRILKSNQQSIFEYQMKISNYQCQHNIGQSGTCLLIDQISTSIENSIFQFNNSTFNGGALAIKGKQQFYLKNCIITQNQALIGGGLYLEDQQALSFSYFKVQLNENYALHFGNNFFSPPEKLSIIMNNSGKIMRVFSLLKNQTYQIDEIQNNGQNDSFNYIYLPSGQQIKKYEQFLIKMKTYQALNLSLYLVALQSDNTITKDLEYSSCEISSRKYDLNKKDQEQLFTNNYTNMNQVFYDTLTNSYNLDELILYFGIDNQTNEFLQLQFE